MITEIPKGIDQDSGLPQFIKRKGYWHNEKAAIVEIYYDLYIKYPSGKTETIKEGVDYIQDIPAQAAVDAIPGISEAIPAIAASTKYTDYYKQYNEDVRGVAIDEFLTTLVL